MAIDVEPREVGLVWSADDDPGWTRRRAGKGFSYRDEDGVRITDERALARVKALAIPPAWTDVWICADPRGHLQATGRDARGRKQYRYHPGWRARCEEIKYERLVEFGAALPALRRAVATDLARRDLSRDKVVATVVVLLQTTSVRVGNDAYAKENQSYGLTTLRDPHARIDGAEVRFRFTGKSGRKHTVTVRDRRLARTVQRCQDLPGQRLFQYEGDDGEPHPVKSDDVNAYIRQHTGDDFTAKDFRTWMGTLLAASALATLDPPESATAAKREAAAAIDVVARQLGNTPSVARTSYVHPDVIDLYADGSLAELWARPPRRRRELLDEEQRLLTVLKEAARRQRRNRRSRRADLPQAA